MTLPYTLRTESAVHWEDQYLALMDHIWRHGDERRDRTGVGTRSVFGAQIRCDLSDDRMPLLTTKRVYWKTATRELLWFLTGDTNIRSLCAQGVEIWTDWPLDRYRKETGDPISREDFSARIVADEAFAAQWGNLGPVYGKQWVDWPTYQPAGEGLYRKGQGVNQIAELVHSLRQNPAAAAISSRAGMWPSLIRWRCRPATRPISSMWPTGVSRACSISGVLTWPWGCPSICGARRC
jgi:thymidylate synthase